MQTNSQSPRIMTSKTNPMYEAPQSRIMTLINRIGEQLKAITTPADSNKPNDASSVIAEQERVTSAKSNHNHKGS